MFTKIQVVSAELSGDLYHKIGRIGEVACEDLLYTIKIYNCPIIIYNAC